MSMPDSAAVSVGVNPQYGWLSVLLCYLQRSLCDYLHCFLIKESTYHMQIRHFMVNNVPSELQGTTPPALCCQMAFKTHGKAFYNIQVY